ncbi:hypothetical protein [Pseudomonas sp. UBA6323]|uniref:hypothetical protein n=1 Tax=Pseudomonas sp. UBA6323 TaxID=1947329 RepID=UPI0025F298A1|nr:hypothetical protein [Pseudomonas sp. UBA6323]
MNLFMKLEGRRFASDLVLSARSLLHTHAGTQELIGNLQLACTGRPASYAAGITEIIDLIRSQEDRPCA